MKNFIKFNLSNYFISIIIHFIILFGITFFIYKTDRRENDYIIIESIEISKKILTNEVVDKSNARKVTRNIQSIKKTAENIENTQEIEEIINSVEKEALSVEPLIDTLSTKKKVYKSEIDSILQVLYERSNLDSATKELLFRNPNIHKLNKWLSNEYKKYADNELRKFSSDSAKWHRNMWDFSKYRQPVPLVHPDPLRKIPRYEGVRPEINLLDVVKFLKGIFK